MSDIISVLTFKSVETILKNGGTQSWVLDRKKAANCDYVVVCRNANSRTPEDDIPHGTAFLVGKIKDVVPSTEVDNRWLIKISEYALIDVPEQWEGRNPVGYWKDNAYDDIDFKNLPYTPLETGLTIGEAKLGLSVGLGVPVEAIEIIIRS